MTHTTTARRRDKRPLLKSFRLWVPVGIVILLLAAAIPVILLVPKAFAAKDALMAALPLADVAKEQILAGDPAANETVAELSRNTSKAADEVSGVLWSSMEWIPVAGPNLKAVRVAAQSTDELTQQVLVPLGGFSLDQLKPVDGAINLERLIEVRETVERAAPLSAKIQKDLAALDTANLIDQVGAGVEKLSGAVEKLEAAIEPAETALQIIPAMLGADGPQQTLMMFQNNAEVRSTGGNPAAVMLLQGDGGRFSIVQQASSQDLAFGRPTSILPLDPEAVALYTDRFGRWATDLTYTPDVNEQAALLRAFWAEAFGGTPIDNVSSFDPVALSYLLRATGPLTLETGDVLTADNAVSLLLNEAYLRYPTNDEQDDFFAAAARSVFDALTGGDVDVKVLVDALTQAVAEGRLMFNTTDQATMDLLGSSPVAGPLPSNNDDTTVLGVFINDMTGGKTQYYLTNDVTAESTQCSVNIGDAASFAATATVTNTLSNEIRAQLPVYVIAGEPMLQRGINAVNLVFYGPVGSEFESITSEGAVGDSQVAQHLGRPVVQLTALPGALQSVTVTATFKAAPGQAPDSFSDFEVRTTPLAHETPKVVSTPGCK